MEILVQQKIVLKLSNCVYASFQNTLSSNFNIFLTKIFQLFGFLLFPEKLFSAKWIEISSLINGNGKEPGHKLLEGSKAVIQSTSLASALKRLFGSTE